MLLKWIIIAIVALPIAELALFILLAAAIGTLHAILLQLAISAAGVLVLRQAGSARLSQPSDEVSAQEPAGWRISGPKGILLIAGILLLVPGFITDLLGLGLLVPQLRRRIGALARGALEKGRRAGSPVIDLAPSEWRDITKRKPAKRRRRPTPR
jgi:UPF0716 protein FxsA